MAWKSAYLESRILAADPLELVNILYEHAIQRVQLARECLSQRDIAGRSSAIAKAIAILGELEGSLDHSAGGVIAQNLSRLYRYIRERLVVANLRQQDEPLAEAERLLTTLGAAWLAISPSGQTAHPVPMQAAEVHSMDGWSA